MNADIFWRAPEFVAAQLATALDIPMLNYRPTSMKDVLDNLPAGLVDWEPGIEWNWGARDMSAEVEMYLVAVVLVDGSGEAAVRTLRQLVGQVVQWGNEKRRLTSEEVGAVVKRMVVSSIDWQELSEETGLKLHGRVVQAGGVLLRLLLADK